MRIAVERRTPWNIGERFQRTFGLLHFQGMGGQRSGSFEHVLANRSLEVEIERQNGLRVGETIVEVDGRPLPGGVLREVEPGKILRVRVACG